MNKINKKGFMLAEVIVVSTVVVTVLVSLFTGLNRVSTSFEIRNKYYDVDAAYQAYQINEILIKNNFIVGLIKNNFKGDLYSNGPDEIIDLLSDNILNINQNNIHYYFSKYTFEYLDDIAKNASINNKYTLDYIEYLKTNLDFSADYNYLIIVAIEKNNNNNLDESYYYTLKVR